MKPFPLFLLLTFFAVFTATSGQNPHVSKGVMDLRGIEKKDRISLNLNGQWEFYWNRMLYPNDFKNGSPSVPV